MKRKRENSITNNSKKIKYSVPDILILETTHMYLTCFVKNNEINVFVIDKNNKLLNFYGFNNQEIPWIMKTVNKRILLEIPKDFRLPKIFCKSNFLFVINKSINIFNFKERKTTRIDVKEKIKDYCFYSNTLIVCANKKVKFYQNNKLIKEFIPFLSEEDELLKTIIEPSYKNIKFLKYFCVQCLKNNECSIKEEHNISHDNFIFIGNKNNLQIYNVKIEELYSNVINLKRGFRVLTINNTNLYVYNNKSITEIKINSQNQRKQFSENGDIVFGVYYNELFFYVTDQNIFGVVNLINKEKVLEKNIFRKVKDLKFINKKVFIVVYFFPPPLIQ